MATLTLTKQNDLAVQKQTAFNDLNLYLVKWGLKPHSTIREAWLAVSEEMDTTCYCHEGLLRNGSMCCLCLWKKFMEE